MSRVRFALIGCGAIAQKHVTALSRLEDAAIVGCFDINPAAAQRFGQKHGIEAFASVEQLVEQADPDFFNVLTPSGCHAANVLDLVQFNRHFVVEKPLALQLSDVDRILHECATRELRVYTVKQNRFNPPVFQLKRAIESGRFGRMVMGTVRVRWMRDQAYYDQSRWRGTWAADGGVLTNQACHHIDALLWLMGDVDTVQAKIATRLVDIEAEDTGVAILGFANGALGVVEATTGARPRDLEGSLSILGEKGSVEVGGFFMNELKTWNFVESHPMDDEVCSEHAKVPAIPAWNHTEFFRDVIRSYQTGQRGLVDGLEGRRSVELLTAIYESAERAEEVSLRFRPRVCRLGVPASEPVPPLKIRRAA
ncbi:MAG: Gfo/Idh/MocA family protein [Pirellulaceae bacterium]